MTPIQPRSSRASIRCRPLLLAALLTVALAWPAAAADLSAPVTLAFLDTGGEDALLLHQPGRCALLVDAGPPGSGRRLGQALGRRGITRLDRLVISHPHQDHFGGVLTLPATLAIATVNDNGAGNDGEPDFAAYRRWRRQFAYQPLAAGAGWRCGDLEVTVLAADARPTRPEEINDGSLVLAVTVGPVRLLLPGDIEAGGRRALIAGTTRLQAAIVKIPHHGKDAGHLGPWLAAVRPELAVVSPGRDLAVDPAAFAIVRSSSGEVWRTDLQGDLELTIDQRGWHHVRP